MFDLMSSSIGKAIVGLLLITALLTASCRGTKEIILISEGKSEYTLIIPEAAGSLEIQAALLLQHYIYDISGADIPVRTDTSLYTGKEIIIGNNTHLHDAGFDIDPARLEPDGFIIQTRGNDLAICGAGEKGTLYGVYSFLEEYLGCRLYAPGVKVVPGNRTITLGPVDEVHIPVFNFRELHFPCRQSQEYLDWHKLHWKGTSQQDWGMWVHTFDDLVPPEEFFGTHPEYFSEINGMRVPYGQLCLSNTDVFDTLVSRLEQKMNDLPQAHYWSVSQNDTYYPCTCKECSTLNEQYGGYSGSIIWFVNRVAEKFPGKTISTLAYQYSRSAPTGIIPAGNVNIMLCTIELNRSMPISTDPSSASFRGDIAAWGKLTDNILIWDYVVQFRNYLDPFPNLMVLQPNLQFFRDHNATMMFQQGSGGSWSEFHELRTYLIAKLLWDPDVDLDEVMDDFLQGYYGPAGRYIREYIDLMHRSLARSKASLGIYGYPFDGIDNYLKPALLKKYEAILDRAEQAVEGQPEYQQRVEAARLPLEFAILDLSLRNINDELSYFSEAGGQRTVREDMRQRLHAFSLQAEALGIERIEEHGTRPSDYVEIIENYLDKSMMDNSALHKKVQLLTNYSEKYPVGGAAALTDGLRGLPDYHFNWLGFEGEDLEAIIDLGEMRSVSCISADFLQQYNSWIWLPEKVEYSISGDGDDFEVLAEVENVVPEKRPGVFTETFKAEFGPVEARYVKIYARSKKACPLWHIGSGLPCWIFTDEIVIQ